MAPGIGGTWREEDAGHGAAAVPKLHPGGLTGLAVAFAVVPLAVSKPPRGLDEKTYFLALWGVFIAGVAQMIAAVWLSNNGPRRRRAAATATKLMYCASVAAIVVTASLSAASLPW